MSNSPNTKRQRLAAGVNTTNDLDMDVDVDNDISMAVEVDMRHLIFEVYPTEPALVADYKLKWRVARPLVNQDFRKQRGSRGVSAHFTYKGQRIRWPCELDSAYVTSPSDFDSLCLPTIQQRFTRSNTTTPFKVGRLAVVAYLSQENYVIGDATTRTRATDAWIERHGAHDVQVAKNLLAALSTQDKYCFSVCSQMLYSISIY
jgi:hypothetical protein